MYMYERMYMYEHMYVYEHMYIGRGGYVRICLLYTYMYVYVYICAGFIIGNVYVCSVGLCADGR